MILMVVVVVEKKVVVILLMLLLLLLLLLLLMMMMMMMMMMMNLLLLLLLNLPPTPLLTQTPLSTPISMEWMLTHRRLVWMIASPIQVPLCSRNNFLQSKLLPSPRLTPILIFGKQECRHCSGPA